MFVMFFHSGRNLPFSIYRAGGRVLYKLILYVLRWLRGYFWEWENVRLGLGWTFSECFIPLFNEQDFFFFWFVVLLIEEALGSFGGVCLTGGPSC